MTEMGRSPIDFGLWVRSDSKSLYVTALNKMKNTGVIERSITFSGKVIETPYIRDDDEKNALDNQLYYNQSSFKGSKLFDYVTTDDSGATIDEDLNKAIVTDGYGNYIFDNIIRTQTFTYYDYTILKDYEGFKFFKLNGQDIYLNNWYISKDTTTQYITTEITVTDNKVYEIIDDVKYTVFNLANKISANPQAQQFVVGQGMSFGSGSDTYHLWPSGFNASIAELAIKNIIPK